MIFSPVKYSIVGVARKLAGVFVLVLCYVVSFAQEEEYIIDTTVVYPPDSGAYQQPDSYEEETEEEETTVYFTPRKMEGSGMDSFQLRSIPDSVLQRLGKDEDFWYAGISVAVESPKQKSGEISNQSWFQTLLWFIIIAGFGVFVILYLSNSNIGLFRKRNRNIGEEGGDPETDDIFAINYQKEIDKAAATGNFRLAIRLMFLRLLKNLAEKNIIQYKHDRTNFDYLVQLSPTKYYHDFFRITRNYEYSWYGKFQVNEDAYKIIKTEIERFDPAMK